MHMCVNGNAAFVTLIYHIVCKDWIKSMIWKYQKISTKPKYNHNITCVILLNTSLWLFLAGQRNTF